MTTFREASKALADELELKPHEVAELVQEYRTLSQAIRTTVKRSDQIKDRLKDYLKAHDGYFDVEGLPRLKLQPRRGTPTCDLIAMHQASPVEFFRLLELGCLTLNHTLATEQEKAGNVTAFRGYVHETTTEALVFEREP